MAGAPLLVTKQRSSKYDDLARTKVESFLMSQKMPMSKEEEEELEFKNKIAKYRKALNDQDSIDEKEIEAQKQLFEDEREDDDKSFEADNNFLQDFYRQMNQENSESRDFDPDQMIEAKIETSNIKK